MAIASLMTAVAAAAFPQVAAASRGPGGIHSDDFIGGFLDTSVWRLVNPVGDATLSVSGSRAVLEIPAGASHDLWAGTFGAPRLLQDIPDGDFEVEVKLDGLLASRFQMQGILVVDDADDLLRLEVHHDGTTTYLFAASFVSGTGEVKKHTAVALASPVYLRVARNGDWWTLRYSADGANWLEGASFLHPMTVRSLGVFAGNSGSPAPAFTLPVDYVRDVTPGAPPDTTPPSISGVAASTSDASARVTWTTDEPATSVVEYGTTSGYGSTASTAGSTTTHDVTVSGLACGTTYHFRVRSADGAGNEAAGADATLSTQSCAPTPEAVRGDEFDGAAIDNTLWRFDDTVGDAQASLSSGRLRIAVPAGASHDLWTGSLVAPRLLQRVLDEDFEIELKLDTLLNAAYQMQGLVVQQDRQNLLRFEVHSNGTDLNLFAASISDGVATGRVHVTLGQPWAPVFLRVKRVGSVWTVAYSRNGTSWTSGGSFSHALAVTDVGPFVGNSGSPAPGVDAAFDYFRLVSAGTPPPDTTPPVIAAVAATVRSTSATVTWTTNEPATSAIDYGPTAAYGNSVAGAGATTTHALSVDGLTCATTYHFGVRSSDASGNAASTPDATFTTVACPGAVVSDDFDGASLDQSLWRLADPRGDSTVSTSGGKLLLSVAAGVPHDLWTGAVTAPRLLQAVGNGDFVIEAKFDTAVAQAFQMQGLVAQQDDGNLVRFDAFSNGTETRLFGATFRDGIATGRLDQRIAAGAPLFLRMRRSGDTWSLLFSRAGSVWTQAATFSHALVISEVGLFAGNNGIPSTSSPSFTAAVDSFHNAETAPPPPPDTTPPVLQDVAVTAGVSTATITWNTDEPSSSSVAFGRSAAHDRTQATAEFTAGHTVALRGLACETSYHFAVRSADEDGNQAVGADATFTTGPCPPPIAGDEFDGTAIGSGWQFVDPRGDSALAGPSGGRVTITIPAGTNHDLWSGANHAPRLVQPTRDEDFEVEARFASPVASRHQMQGLVVEQDEDNLLRFEVHSDGTRSVLFAAALVAGAAQTKHSSVVTDGPVVAMRVKRAGTTWTFRSSTDGTTWTSPVSFSHPLTVTRLGPFAGNTGTPAPAVDAQIDHFRVITLGTPPPDTTPPVVGGVTTSTSAETASLTWTTDEPATTSLRYGTSASYGTTLSSSELATSHRRDLIDLPCETTHHFQIVARDEVGNESVTADSTFTTGTCPPPDVTPPVISTVSVQPNVRSAYVTWITDERATSAVDYGADASYGQVVEDAQLVTTHRVYLPNLACGTDYHFRVRSSDRSGNATASSDAVLRTATCPPIGGPEIDVWYGDDQVFGVIGTPQDWANIVGHADDPDGVAHVTYSLNGGPATTLEIRPEYNVRIVQFGDFNIELDIAALTPGPNHVEIVATDPVGYQSSRVVTVRYQGTSAWPLPYTADWSTAARISDIAQVVDGLWTLEGSDVRPLISGYDRVIAVGERTWLNYEVTLPFTINALSSTSQHAGFGIAVGWQGHAGPQRPRVQYPFGLLCFYYRNFPADGYHLWLMGSDDSFIVEDGRLNFLQLGTRYVMKMRNESIGGGMSRYSCKVWQSAHAEPPSWNVVAERPARPGSVILVQDYSDVSFGPLAVRPLAGG